MAYSDELIQRLMRLGGAGQRQQALAAQMAQAQALGRQQPERSTALGSAIGGLANAGGALASSLLQAKLRGDMAGEEQANESARADFLRAYGQDGQAGRQQEAAQSLSAFPVVPFAGPEYQQKQAEYRDNLAKQGAEQRQQRATDVALLSGDPILKQWAAAQQKGDAAEARDLGLKLREQNLALALEAEKRRQGAEGWRQDNAVEQRDWSAEQRRLDRISRERAASLLAGAKEQDSVEKATKEFGEDIAKTGAPGFYARLDTAKRLLAKYPNDIPGYGRFEGHLPDDAISEDGRVMRQAIGQMLAEYQKGQSGSGMSDTERANYGRITGLLQTGDERSVRQGVAMLEEAMNAKVRASAGAYKPEAVKTYGQRVQRVGEALGVAPAGEPMSRVPASQALPKDTSGQPTLDAPSVPADVVKVRKPDGTVVPIKRSNLDKALKLGGVVVNGQ